MVMKKLLAALPIIAALTGQAVAGPAAQAQGTPAVRTVRLGRRGRRLLDDVNAQVNRDFRALAPIKPGDLDRGGDGKWDCEDYAGEKRQRLLEAGVPATAMRTWDVTVGWGELHQVLVVYGEDGAHVLDNLHNRPMAPEALAARSWNYSGWAVNWPPVRPNEVAPADPAADWSARVAG